MAFLCKLDHILPSHFTLPVRDVVVGTISRALCLITVEKTMPEDEEFNLQCNDGMDSGDVDLMTRIE